MLRLGSIIIGSLFLLPCICGVIIGLFMIYYFVWSVGVGVGGIIVTAITTAFLAIGSQMIHGIRTNRPKAAAWDIIDSKLSIVVFASQKFMYPNRKRLPPTSYRFCQTAPPADAAVDRDADRAGRVERHCRRGGYNLSHGLRGGGGLPLLRGHRDHLQLLGLPLLRGYGGGALQPHASRPGECTHRPRQYKQGRSYA